MFNYKVEFRTQQDTSTSCAAQTRQVLLCWSQELCWVLVGAPEKVDGGVGEGGEGAVQGKALQVHLHWTLLLYDWWTGLTCPCSSQSRGCAVRPGQDRCSTGLKVEGGRFWVEGCRSNCWRWGVGWWERQNGQARLQADLQITWLKSQNQGESSD